jgi:nitrite reductase/ring-hydroxylating ferredoxin subunit
MALFVSVAAYRGGPAHAPDGTSLILSAVGVVVLGISGWLGGTLVYRNQIAVDHRYANAGKFRERNLARWDMAVCGEAELKEGQMILADIAGERLVVGRCADGIVAFSDHCTHKGGPLSDGALVGCTVQCPWHGSQFDVHSGKVVNGPAKEKIETFEAEVRNGQVYVRPRRGGQEKEAA